MLDEAARSGIIDPREIALAREIMDEVEGEQGKLGYPVIRMNYTSCKIYMDWGNRSGNCVEVTFYKLGSETTPSMRLRVTVGESDILVRSIALLDDFIRRVRKALHVIEERYAIDLLIAEVEADER